MSTRNLFHWLFLFLAVINVVAFRGLHFLLKIGDASLNKNVVPLDEFLNVGVLHTVAVPLGQYLRKIVMQLAGRSLLGVYAGLLAILDFLHALKDGHQGHIVSLGVHGYVGQRRNAVVGKSRLAAVGAVERLNDEVVLAA